MRLTVISRPKKALESIKGVLELKATKLLIEGKDIPILAL
jgi:hypothetical protein